MVLSAESKRRRESDQCQLPRKNLTKLKERGRIEKYNPSQTLRKSHRNFSNSYAERRNYEKHYKTKYKT
jgi:hypothetical protein